MMSGVLHGPDDPDWQAILVRVLIAEDVESKLWSEREVKLARDWFARMGGIPSFEKLSRPFGREWLDAAFQKIIQNRIAEINLQNKLKGASDPCHSCGSRDSLSYHDFGLARILKQERDWKMTGLSIALSAASLSLGGMGKVYGPSKTTTGNLLRMRLVLCGKCFAQRASLFGGFTPREHHCTIHPMWTEAREAGFTKFVTGKELLKWH